MREGMKLENDNKQSRHAGEGHLLNLPFAHWFLMCLARQKDRARTDWRCDSKLPDFQVCSGPPLAIIVSEPLT